MQRGRERCTVRWSMSAELRDIVKTLALVAIAVVVCLAYAHGGL